MIDNQIKKNDLSFFELVLERITKRLHETKIFYTENCKFPINWRLDELSNSETKLLYFSDSIEIPEPNSILYIVSVSLTPEIFPSIL